jgi:hypothetical protein
MERRNWFAAPMLMLAAVAPAHASDLRFAGGLWDYSVRGFQDDHGTVTDLQTFAQGRQRDGFLDLQWTHRPSWWPDLAASYAQLSGDGTQATSAIPGGGLPLPLPIPDPTATTTTAEGSFREFDVTARYAIQLGPIQVSPGVSLGWITGHITTSTTDLTGTTTTERSYNNPYPMLHAQIAWPFADRFRLSSRIDWIQAGHNEVLQFGAAAEIRLLGPIGVYGGWEDRRYKISTSDSYLDARLRGARYGLLVVF